MTFQKFQATRREVPNLAAALPDVCYGGINGPGFVYLSCLFIVKNPKDDTRACPEAYLLLTFNESIASDDLAALEQELFEFAQDEDFV